MLGLTVTLGVACLILIAMLSTQDNKNAKLTAENSLMKGRMGALQELRLTGQHEIQNEPLSIEGIEASVRHAGYVPESNDNWVRFMVAGEAFFIDTARLPKIFISRFYSVQTSDWDMDLLKKAAHIMSDEIIMVKAIFNERPNDTELRFFVAAMDRNYTSFRDNLMEYIGIIHDGNRRMIEIYDRLVEQRDNLTQAVNPFANASQQDPTILS